MTKKRLTVLLAATLSLMLCGALIAGCAQQASAENSQAIASGEAAVSSAEDEIYGTIVLRVNPEIAVSYDKSGNVVKVEGLNDDGRALVPDDAEFIGQPCRSVVEALLGKFNEAGYLVEEVEGEGRQVQIELEDGSHMPTHNFLNDIVEGADSYAHTNKVNAVFAVSGTTDYGWSYYDDTDYGPSNDGVTDYDDTDYGPNNDGDSRYDDKNDGTTDYAGKTDYDKDNTDYGNSNYTKPSSGSSSGGSSSAGGSSGGSSGGASGGGDSGYSNYGDSNYTKPSTGGSSGGSKPSGGSSGSSGGGSSTPAPEPDPAPVTPPSGGGGGNSDYGDSNYGGGGNSNYGDSSYGGGGNSNYGGGGDSGYSNYGDSGYDD